MKKILLSLILRRSQTLMKWITSKKKNDNDQFNDPYIIF